MAGGPLASRVADDALPRSKSFVTSGHRLTWRWYAGTASPPRATLVLAPGAGAGHEHPFLVSFATAITAHGIEVATFNFPYFEAGRRRPDPPGVLEQTWRDAITAARAARAPGTRPLVIGGKSMGGRMATHAAASAGTKGNLVAGVVCLGYPLHPPGRASTRSLEHFASIGRPVLILQGTRDPFGGAEAIVAAASGLACPVTVRPVTDADHGFAVPRRSGRTAEQVIMAMAAEVAGWIALLEHSSEN